MARHTQAIHGYQAIHGWPGSAVGPEHSFQKPCGKKGIAMWGKDNIHKKRQIRKLNHHSHTQPTNCKPIPWQCFSCRSLASSLVSISTVVSAVGVYSSAMCLSSYAIRMKWCLISICFVRSWNWGLWVILMLLLIIAVNQSGRQEKFRFRRSSTIQVLVEFNKKTA